MTASHLEFLVEEPSAEAFLSALVPRITGNRITFDIHVHQGKQDLLRKLGARLRGYSKWLPETSRIIVLLDRDDEDCHRLKRHLEVISLGAGLATRTTTGMPTWQVANRIACEELEAWFLGDWEALRLAYPRLPARLPGKAAFRNPDAIAGGTWEALERILKASGYYSGGLRKIECSQTIAKHFEPSRSASRSFQVFWQAIAEAAA